MYVRQGLSLSLPLSPSSGGQKRGGRGEKEKEPTQAHHKHLPSLKDQVLFKGFNTAASLGSTYPPDLKKEADTLSETLYFNKPRR